ncbi:hypothetical protein DWY29_12800 [Roseburia inulinivorans]|uniref:Uncharacterized protein n=1 Tax=Roseburia inulinivorans TaxID=360807 RepID=A0A3R5W9F5_9FIRM|nr:hypothetical protein DWY29_12800 [Roseburia inulinivorans]
MAALPSCITLYEISIRQTRDFPVVSLFLHPASFRFHLTMDALAFGYILPTTGWIRDFNPLETCAAGHANKTTDVIPIHLPFYFLHNFIYPVFYSAITTSRPEQRLRELHHSQVLPLHYL